MVTGLRELAEALEADGTPRHNGVRRRPDGQLVVDAWPSGIEALLWGGFRGEVWIEPGQEASQVRMLGAVGRGLLGLLLPATCSAGQPAIAALLTWPEATLSAVGHALPRQGGRAGRQRWRGAGAGRWESGGRPWVGGCPDMATTCTCCCKLVLETFCLSCNTACTNHPPTTTNHPPHVTQQLPVAALDVLHKLVVDDEVVICKMNPVNEYLGPFVRWVSE